MMATAVNAQIRNPTLAKRATPGCFKCKNWLSIAVREVYRSPVSAPNMTS
jgi:hypothetical protein